MTTTTLTLSAFLLARYDEWESWVGSADYSPVATGQFGIHRCYMDSNAASIAMRILDDNPANTWLKVDPAFVLAQVASLRAVVELHAGLAADDQEYSGWQQLGQQTLLALAQPFRDHPDMRPEWVTG